jgi:EmrB/QacA subfamily drug resistance transporter
MPFGSPDDGVRAADALAPATGADGRTSRQLFFAMFPSIMLPMFMGAIDQTIVATALPGIAADLGDIERITWVVVSYLVANTIAAPVYGRLGDVFGRRRLLLAALSFFIVASLLCAASRSVVMLTIARVLQGLGGGGLMSLSQALVGEAVPPRERGRYQGYLASVVMCSSTFGPVAGGWLTQNFGWQSVFLVNLPLGALAIVMALRLPQQAGTGSGGRFTFDFLGVAFLAGFIAPALLALEQAQRFDIRALPLGLIALAVSICSLLLLLRQETRVKSPLLPLKLLAQPAIWRPDALAACIGATIVSLVTFLPIYLQVVRGVEPGRVGVLLLPLTALMAVGSIITGRLVTGTGRSAVWPSFGMPVVAIALMALSLLAPRLNLLQLPILFGIIALANGSAMPVVQTTVQMVAGPKHLGAAAASVQFSRSIGAAIGTAVVGAVLFAVLSAADPDTARLFARLVEEGPAALAGLSLTRIAIVQAEIADAFKAAFFTVACFAGLGALFAWSIPVRRVT